MMALCAPIDLNYSKLNYTAMKHFNLLKTTLLLCALIVGSLSSWATDVTYNFSSFTSEQTVTLKTDNDNLTITLSKGSGSTNPAWTSSQAKVYAKGSLTIASASKKNRFHCLYLLC